MSEHDATAILAEAPPIPGLTVFYELHGPGGEPLRVLDDGALDSPAYELYMAMRDEVDPTDPKGATYRTSELDAEAEAIVDYADALIVAKGAAGPQLALVGDEPPEIIAVAPTVDAVGFDGDLSTIQAVDVPAHVQAALPPGATVARDSDGRAVIRFTVGDVDHLVVISSGVDVRRFPDEIERYRRALIDG